MFRIIQVRDDKDHLDFAMLGGLRFWCCSHPGASRSQLLARYYLVISTGTLLPLIKTFPFACCPLAGMEWLRLTISQYSGSQKLFSRSQQTVLIKGQMLQALWHIQSLSQLLGRSSCSQYENKCGSLPIKLDYKNRQSIVCEPQV